MAKLTEYSISGELERRIIYIDVGKISPYQIERYLEEIKNEIRQKITDESK